MLVDENKRSLISFFVRPTEVVHFSIVIGVPRGWLKMFYRVAGHAPFWLLFFYMPAVFIVFLFLLEQIRFN